MSHNYIGTEHILLGVIREGEGVAAQVLVAHGVALDECRERIVRTLKGTGEAKAWGNGAHLLDEVRAMIEENNSMRAELDRLRQTLRAHGIDPQSGQQSA
jgi:ATP-dependent Clp protease ATP-binding subunit ClpA